MKTRTHDLYESFRVETDPKKKLQIFEESVAVAENFPVPEDVLRIPVVVLHSPPNLVEMWATRLYDQAEREEPALTKKIETLFGDHLRGVENRRKVCTSIARKLKVISLAEDVLVDVALKQATDCIRYTVVYDRLVYTAEVRATLQMLDALESFQVETVINYWKFDDCFRGVYVVVRLGEGALPFEIQFHTPESYEVKEEKVDALVEGMVLDPSQAEALYAKAQETWRLVVAPAKVRKIVWPLAPGSKKCVLM